MSVYTASRAGADCKGDGLVVGIEADILDGFADVANLGGFSLSEPSCL